MSAHESQGGCGRIEDAAAYVLGALGEDENTDFLAHLDSCRSCREEAANLQVVVDALPVAVEQVSAPPALKRKLMTEVARDAPALPGAGRGEPRARVASARGGSSWRSRRPAFALGALAAAVGVLIGALLASGGAQTRVIRAHVLPAGASASLRVAGEHAQLEIAGMPQTGPRRVYELWIKRSGAPQPTDALFTVTSGGAASVGVPGAIKGVSAVLVTSEPLGGSRVPTTTPLIIAPLG